MTGSALQGDGRFILLPEVAYLKNTQSIIIVMKLSSPPDCLCKTSRETLDVVKGGYLLLIHIVMIADASTCAILTKIVSRLSKMGWLELHTD